MFEEDGSGFSLLPPGLVAAGARAIAAAAIALFAAGASADDYVAPAYVGAANSSQRGFGVAPDNGTLTTGATIPAWAPTTVYSVDPSSGAVNRVNNGAFLYQCRTSGTSASSGGPTGTGPDITDGTAHWAFEGAAPTANLSASGSQLIGIIARGTQSTAASIPPVDNDGGSYVAISNTTYSGFPNSFAGVFRRTGAASGKVGLTTSAAFGNIGSAGQGDEITNSWIELHGVQVGAPHAVSQVERATATANVDTAANITTTVRCLIVSFWFGNGSQIAVGTSHSAVPLGGLQLVPGATSLMAINGSGYIQVGVGWRIANAGTFAESWSTTGEGAQLVTIAYALASQIGITDSDEAPSWLARAQLAPAMDAQPAWRTLQAVAAQDETVSIAPPPVVDDDAGWAPPLIWHVDPARAANGGDDEPVQAPAGPLDELWVASVAPCAPVHVLRLPLGDPEEIPAATLFGQPDEDFWAAMVAPAPVSLRVQLPLGDPEEIPAATLFGVPEESEWVAPPQAPLAWRAPVFAELDELPIGIDDDSGWRAPFAMSQSWPVRALTADDDLQPSLTVDDDIWLWPAPAPVPWRATVLGDDADMPASTLTVDEDPWLAPTLQLLSWRGSVFVDSDELLPQSPGSIVDDESPLPPVVAPLAWRFQLFAELDELPIGIDDDAVWRAPFAMSQSWPVRALTADDDLQGSLSVDEDAWSWPLPAPVPWRATVLGDDADMAVASVQALTIDEDAWPWPVPAAVAAWRPVAFTADDEPPIAPTGPLTIDEDSWQAPVLQPIAWRVVAFTDSDELPLTGSIIQDESPLFPAFPAPPWRAVLFSESDEFPTSAPASAPGDDDAWRPGVWASELLRVVAFSDDETVAIAALRIDDDAWLPPRTWVPISLVLAVVDDDVIAALAADDDAWAPRTPWTVDRAAPPVPIAADEVPSQPLIVDEDSWIIPAAAQAPWAFRIAPLDTDVFVPFIPPPPIVDEDYWLTLPRFLVWPVPIAPSRDDQLIIPFIATTVIDPKGTRVTRTAIAVILIPAPTVRVVHTAAVARLVGVGMADPEPFRQGRTHRPLTALAFTADRLVDFPSEFPGGLTFRAVNGTTIVTGSAVGDGVGKMTYSWAPTDLDVVGHWRGYFEGTDGAGKKETFPDGTEIEYDVIATI